MTDQDAARSDPPLAAGTTATTTPGRLSALLARPDALLARPDAPVLFALGLALLTSPVVAWSLTLAPKSPWLIEEAGWVPVDAAPAMLLALAAVVPAALVGGWLGGIVRLQRPVLGAFVAVWISWAIGIVVLPAAAALLGVTLRIGTFCIDICSTPLRDDDPFSGIGAYGSTLEWGVIVVLPALIGGVLAIFAAVAARRHALLAVGVVLAVLAHGAVHFWSLREGGLNAWLCLAGGVVIWSVVLPRPAPRAAAPLPTTAWPAAGSGLSAEQGLPAASAAEPPAGREPAAPPAGQPPLPLA